MISFPILSGIMRVQIEPTGDRVIINKSKKVHEQITRETWKPGLYETTVTNCTTGFCAVGWLSAVYGPIGCDEKRKIIEEDLGRNLTIWNDSYDREFGDVMLLFKRLDI